MNRVYKVFLGYLEIRVTKENPDQLVQLVQQELLDQQDHRVLKVNRENKVNRVLEDIKGYLEIKVTKENLAQPDLKDHKDLKDQLDPLEQMVNQLILKVQLLMKLNYLVQE